MLWIVGKVFEDFREYLVAEHIVYGVFIDQQQTVKVPGNVHIISLDFSSQASLLASLERLPVLPEVTAIMTAGYEHYVLPAAWLCEYFDLPGPTPLAAIAATDKLIMRRQFQRYSPAVTPDFRLVSSVQDVEIFMSSHDFPVMLKPTNLMKSLFITKNNSMEELLESFKTMQHGLPKIQQKLQMHMPPQVLIEEFLTGSMHTVAGFVDAEGEVQLISHIVDCVTAQELGFRDSYLYSRQVPSRVSPSEAKAILEVAEKGVKALGLRSISLHIEIMLGKQGPKIIEIGARIGGYRARIYSYSYGINLHQAAIETAQAKPMKLTTIRQKSCAVIELFPDKLGHFKTIKGANQLQTRPSLLTFAVKRNINEEVGPARHGYRATAIVILGHTDNLTFEQDLQFVKDNVSVELS